MSSFINWGYYFREKTPLERRWKVMQAEWLKINKNKEAEKNIPC
jgi:hypothetical protein